MTINTSPTTEVCSGTVHALRGLLIPLAVCLFGSFPVLAQQGMAGCGSIERNDGGPFDYRNKIPRLKTVESFHFTPNVENLISGNSSVYVGAELDFTLRAFPNHHRALMAMEKLAERLKTTKPPGASHSVECYFERALRFQPDDNTARLIYATYLGKTRREADALKELEVVTAKAGDNAFTHYNVGLIYFDMKKFDQALAQAHIAYGMGFGRPELRDQLRSAGKWKEPYAQGVNTTGSGSGDAGSPQKPVVENPQQPAVSN